MRLENKIRILRSTRPMTLQQRIALPPFPTPFILIQQLHLGRSIVTDGQLHLCRQENALLTSITEARV